MKIFAVFLFIFIIKTSQLIGKSRPYNSNRNLQAGNNRWIHNMDSWDNVRNDGVIPDVVDDVDRNTINVKYNSGALVEFGKELTPTAVKDQPTMSWPASNDKLYTLAMVDPDAPSRADPKNGQFLHYLVANIPGNEVAKGDELAAYVGSGPPQGTGLHRYVFLVYEQKNGKITSTMKIPNNKTEGRLKFSTKHWAKQNNLGQPIAVNFYNAQYDCYVPILYAQLSGKQIPPAACGK